MDKRRRIKFILLIAVSVFAVLFIAAIVIFVTGIYSSKVSEVLSLQKLYPNTFQTVDVYVDFGNIQVLPSYDANVHLTIYSDSLYNVDTSDNTLSITSSEKGEIPFLKTKSLVQIYLPDMAYQKVSLVSNCGDVSIDQFTQTGFEIDGTLGDVTVTQARSLSVFTDFGESFNISSLILLSVLPVSRISSTIIISRPQTGSFPLRERVTSPMENFPE